VRRIELGAKWKKEKRHEMLDRITTERSFQKCQHSDSVHGNNQELTILQNLRYTQTSLKDDKTNYTKFLIMGINKRFYTPVAVGLVRFECKLSARAALSAIHTFSSLKHISKNTSHIRNNHLRNDETGIDKSHASLPNLVHGRSIMRLGQVSRARKLLILMFGLLDASQGNELHQGFVAAAVDI
jgi:hypothetical protein